MKVFVSKNLGFCSGVERAIQKAMSATGTNVYCLGQLVHNSAVTQMLCNKGICTVDRIAEIPDGSTVIIRAHGVTPEIYSQCEKKNLNVIDATCPYVSLIQRRAKEYFEKGFQVVLVGDSKHPEIVGINGWCKNSAIITDGKEKIRISGSDKAVIMFQTTFDVESYLKSLQNISIENVKTLEIFNTICYTTIDRQNYAHFVSSSSDLVILIGDTHSSNTRKLYSIAEKYCPNILWLTNENVPLIDLSKYKKISIVSGASTPRELIKGVLSRMSEIAKEGVEIVEVPTEVPMNKDETLFAHEISKLNNANYKLGQKVKVTVSEKNDSGLFVRLPNWKQDAFVPNEELAIEDWQAVKDELKTGDSLTCSILSRENGKIVLSKRVIDERYKDDKLIEGIKKGDKFEVMITKTGKDCLVGRLGSYTVIVHASQIKLGFVKNLQPYVGKKLEVVSTADKIDDNKHTIFASHKTILLEQKKEKEDAFWNNIEVNEIVEGKVMRFSSFGAFVSVRDFDCLAHSSDLSWEKINNPSEVLEIGKTYEFAVLALDREKNRVSLGYKQLQPKPWDLAASKFPVGSVVKGTVARILPFGAFVKLDKHIDGLLHISNVSWDWLDDITSSIKIGDEIEVQVMEFDADNKRITLSRKAVMPKPEEVQKETVSTTVDEQE